MYSFLLVFGNVGIKVNTLNVNENIINVIVSVPVNFFVSIFSNSVTIKVRL